MARLEAWTPYATLAIGLALGLLEAVGTPSQAPLTLLLGGVAFVWVYLMYTKAGRRRESPLWIGTYFVGLMAISAAMMLYRPAFFVFVITGFVHAFLLKRPVLAVAGVAATSLIINSRIVFPEAGPGGWSTYLIIVVIQTVAIGLGAMGSEKIFELSEQRRNTVEELTRVIEENAALETQLVEQAREAGVDEERQRMAREIHDTIAQGLTGVITQLEAAGQSEDDAETRRRIDNAMHLARDSLSEARRAVRDLVPAPLEARSLPDALDEVTSSWSSLSHVPADLTTTGTPLRLHPEVEVTLLRVTQEALANVAKHAAASRVGVTLSYMGDIVSIDIRDNGKGINGGADGSGAGFGLTAMRQRVEGLAGSLEIESDSGAGTAVSAFLPAVRAEGTHG